MVLTPGARTLVRTLRRLGYEVAIVSGGFTQVTDHLVADLGIHHSAANTLEVVDGRLTGRVVGPVVDRRARPTRWNASPPRPGCRCRRRSPSATGPTTSTCSRGPAWGSRSTPSRSYAQQAHAAVNVPYLDAVLYLLGIRREDIEAADAADGAPTPRPPLTLSPEGP